KPPSPEEGAGWVLSGFRPELLSVMEKVVGAAAEGVKTWAAEGLEAAQKRYNGLDFRPSEPAET
ncbi:aminoacyl-tRNA hydrolase, partial [Klebsiella pneumoniae]|nr:aminoacyl-tRNA hydrolase [Klebsiella pneumoniae]